MDIDNGDLSTIEDPRLLKAKKKLKHGVHIRHFMAAYV